MEFSGILGIPNFQAAPVKGVFKAERKTFFFLAATKNPLSTVAAPPFFHSFLSTDYFFQPKIKMTFFVFYFPFLKKRSS